MSEKETPNPDGAQAAKTDATEAAKTDAASGAPASPSEASVPARIQPRLIEKEMHASYLDYAMSVIVGRALPDVRDGFKPVHRRVLFAMYELSNTHANPYKKCARVVGEVLGKYHPHGDASIYDTLVRMAQDFSLRYPLVDGQGNFGSIDGDNAAAMRYCISGDSLVCTDKGLVPIASMSDKKEAELSERILSFDGKQNRVTKFFNSGMRDTIEVETAQGYCIKGSLNHPLMCWSKGIAGKPKLEWKLLRDVRKGDVVVLQRGHSLFAKEAFPLQGFWKENKRYTRTRLPKKMNPDLAFLLGALVSEGSFHQKKIIFNNSDMGYYNRVKSIIFSQFRGADLYERDVKGGCRELDLYHQKAVRFLVDIGLGEVKAHEKCIPFSVLRSKKEHIVSFLQGLFEGDGSVQYKVDKRHGGESIELAYHSKSLVLIRQLKIVLLNFGIATTAPYLDKRNGCYKLQVSGVGSIKRFHEKIGFFSVRKKRSLSRILKMNEERMSKTDFVPYLGAYLRRKYGGYLLERHNFDRYALLGKNRKMLAGIIDSGDKKIIDSILKQNYLFSEVSRIIRSKKKEDVYSIRVDSQCHSFVANGFINHNTEARMAKISDEMLLDIDKDTVNFTPNFDGTLKEPSVLPARLPNLLINGSSGIAVGMATNIPPHNLGEVCDAVVLLLDKPESTGMDLAQVVRGPDFPTGAQILGRSGILDAYATGRGSVRVRAVCEIVESKKEKGRQAIKITQLPYQVNKAELVKQIAELARDKKIEGIADIQDRSDKDGLEVHIELKRDANADIVLNHLYSKTPLETSFGIINLALVNGEPKVLPLRDMLWQFILHRREVIRRRSLFDLGVAKERKHILEGLKIALGDIDRIIDTIKKAKDAALAKTALMAGWKLSEKQALAILDTKLSRLTSLERDKIDEEDRALAKQIVELESILADPKKVDAIIRADTLDLRARYGDARRTLIVEGADGTEFEAEDLIPDEPVAVMISEDGYIKRISLDEYKSQRRGGRGVKGSETKEEDRVKDILIARTHDTLLFFTTGGRVHWLKVYRIPAAGRYAMGKAIVNLLDIGQEKISCWIPVREFSDKEYLLMATKKGTVKRSCLADYSRPRKGGIIAITLREGDELIRVRKTDGKSEILLASAQGQSIRFSEEEVREIGRAGQGVKGIELSEGDEVIGFCLCAYPTVMTVCENGYGKRTPIEDYRLQGRAGSGIINIKTEGRNGKVVSVKTVSDEDELLCVSSKGQVIRMPVRDISVVGRNTMGVRLMKLDEGEKVVAVEHMTPEPGPENGNGNGKNGEIGGKVEGDGTKKEDATENSAGKKE